MHPLTYRPHTHIHTVYCSPALTVCTSSSGSPESVIAASVAWTDRRTGDWRWHAPIISGPSAVFAITKGLAEHTESDCGIFYSGAISNPTGCTASIGPGLNSTGLGLCEPEKWVWWGLERISESGLHFSKCLYQDSHKMPSLIFFCRGSTQVAKVGRINMVVKKI